MEPLEKQAERSKGLPEEKEDLKNLDVNVFLLENDRLREQLAGVGEKSRNSLRICRKPRRNMNISKRNTIKSRRKSKNWISALNKPVPS